MVSAKLTSRLGAVKTSGLKDPTRRSEGTLKRTNAPLMGPAKNMVLGIINNHLSTSDKDKVKLKKTKVKDVAVNKSGSRIQVVSRKMPDPPRRAPRYGTTRRREERYGSMRCDQIDQPRERTSKFDRRDLTGLKFSVSSGPNELLGIDLKNVRLKRKILNDVNTSYTDDGELKRTVANKSADRKNEKTDSGRESGEEERPRRKRKENRAIYKNALNDVLENKKKAKSETKERVRESRNRVREMNRSSSREPSPKKKRSEKEKKKPKGDSSESEAEEVESREVFRRPGERGKSAAKDKLEESADAYSPIEGYRLKVSNLNASVSESDLVDLFCAIGAIRDARLMSTPGSAIITFVKRAAAMAAITKYNGRELDKQKITVSDHRIMDLPSKHPYQWRNEYPTKKPRVRQELVGEISSSILLPALCGLTTEGAKPVVFTVKV